MAAPFIRRKAVIMCHYPWAMIFFPHYLELFFSFKQCVGIYREKSHSQEENNRDEDFPRQGYKMKALQNKHQQVQSLGRSGFGSKVLGAGLSP